MMKNEDEHTLDDNPTDPVTAAASAAFGIRYLFPWQRLVVENILDAVDAVRCANGRKPDDDELFDEDGALRGRQIVLLPTGAGKSLCFQIPALLLDGPTLVVYPLLALMGDQTRSLRENGIEPVLFRGGQGSEEREALFRRLEGTDGKPPARLIIANPEVLAGKEVLDRIAACRIAHLAVDEAHCVAEWGDTFRPSYLELGKIIERLDPPAVTAFTATASPPVLARIAEVLYGGSAHLVRGDSDRPNIVYSVHPCRAKERTLILEASRRARPLVVFCATRGGTERTARLLRETFGDNDIRFYHAGLQKDEKLEVEAWFHGHERAILVSTCAWGMGVNKKNVRTVIHRDAPPTAESYIQEAGRGGRDGTVAEAVLLWSPSDKKRIERLPDRQRERAQVLVAFAESGQCRREVLLGALGEKRATDEAAEGERIVCSGCDVCDGTAEFTPADGEAVAAFIEKNPRRHTRDETVSILHEAGNRVAIDRYGFRLWQRADFALIVDELVKEGKLIECEWWPWKNKLTAAPHATFPGSRHRREERLGRHARRRSVLPERLARP